MGSRFVNFQLMLAHHLEVRQDERCKRLQTYQGNKPCLFHADAISGGCDEPCEPVRVGLFDDLKVVLKKAEKELDVIVEGTHEGFARGRAQRLLVRLKGVACGF